MQITPHHARFARFCAIGLVEGIRANLINSVGVDVVESVVAVAIDLRHIDVLGAWTLVVDGQTNPVYNVITRVIWGER